MEEGQTLAQESEWQQEWTSEDNLNDDTMEPLANLSQCHISPTVSMNPC